MNYQRELLIVDLLLFHFGRDAIGLANARVAYSWVGEGVVWLNAGMACSWRGGGVGCGMWWCGVRTRW